MLEQTFTHLMKIYNIDKVVMLVSNFKIKMQRKTLQVYIYTNGTNRKGNL